LSRLPAEPAVPFEILPAELKRRMDANEPIRLIDVREPFEYAVARIGGAELVPMRAVPGRVVDLQAHAEQANLVVFCHHGVRSLQVVNWLRQQGIGNCQSLAGGIERWAAEVDPSVPRY